MLQVEVIFFNKMGVLEALLVLSPDWPGDSTLNQIFPCAKQKAVQEADWTCIIFYFYDKEFFAIHNKKPYERIFHEVFYVSEIKT